MTPILRFAADESLITPNSIIRSVDDRLEGHLECEGKRNIVPAPCAFCFHFRPSLRLCGKNTPSFTNNNLFLRKLAAKE